ncbi:hypothetical protein BBJ29_008941 [Phytophthora kernoviae]|uniref:Uncharacterized protein n=1 Tax=Phytophthora kernoviae TaxID=325452 RepID=A0A3F2RF01_9STRA|nr:hypothetical protein BBJ29_008941 [Phytophthora kernoviae]RLN55180.1 hypothetical protein BBP00_00008619 [Phytophthora kernoviae]
MDNNNCLCEDDPDDGVKNAMKEEAGMGGLQDDGSRVLLVAESTEQDMAAVEAMGGLEEVEGLKEMEDKSQEVDKEKSADKDQSVKKEQNMEDLEEIGSVDEVEETNNC